MASKSSKSVGAAKSASGKGAGTKAEAAGPAKVGPVKFIEQTRQEARKVTWTTWKETLTTSILVLIMVMIFGAFFFFVDGALNLITTFILGFGDSAGPLG